MAAFETTTPCGSLFEQGPPTGLQRRIGLIDARPFNLERRAALVALIGWLPLLVLTLAQDILLHTDTAASLMRESGVHARYLVAAPLLVLADAYCGRRLSDTIRNFTDAGLVSDTQRSRYDAAIAAARDRLTSPAAERIVVMLGIAIAVTAALSHAVDQLPAWHRPPAASVLPAYSLAGWWHVAISLPLLIVLLLGWAWRYALWAVLLWRIARLDLRVVASHPDGAAGLGFAGHSLRGFAIVAVALSAIAAGRSAHFVIEGGTLPTPNLLFNAGYLIAVVAAFAAPLLAFAPLLTRTLQRGTMEYGALAARVGRTFERTWLKQKQRDNAAALDTPDFSATADLYAVTANVHAMRLVPIDLQSILMLTGAVLLPFAPVVLLAVPMNVIWSNIQALLF